MGNDSGRFKTMALDSAIIENLPTKADEYIVQITKLENRPHPMSMITMGRSSNNDISIPIQAVSKLHCIFKQTTDGGIDIVDLSSTNGTFVNEKRLELNQPMCLKGGEAIYLGEVVSGIYLQPDQVHTRLKLGLGHENK